MRRCIYFIGLMILILGNALPSYSAVVNYYTIPSGSNAGNVEVYSIDGLNVEGQLYDVVFEEDDFTNIWIGGLHPQFFNNRAGAIAAGDAIADAIYAEIGNIYWPNYPDSPAPQDRVGIQDRTDYPNIDTEYCQFNIPYAFVGDGNVYVEHYVSNEWGIDPWPIPADGKYFNYDTWNPNIDSYTAPTSNYHVMWATFTAMDTVPIPGAVWLLGSGLIGIVGIRRKFKK